jgi:hypothetical protein
MLRYADAIDAASCRHFTRAAAADIFAIAAADSAAITPFLRRRRRFFADLFRRQRFYAMFFAYFHVSVAAADACDFLSAPPFSPLMSHQPSAGITPLRQPPAPLRQLKIVPFALQRARAARAPLLIIFLRH